PAASSSSSGKAMSPSEKKGGLAERRGTAPKPLQRPDSADADRDELFAKPLRPPVHPVHPVQPAQPAQPAKPAESAPAAKISNAYQQKPYYPPPGSSSRKSSSNL